MTGQAADVQNILARLARLEAHEALRALKQRYAEAADAKYNPDRTRKPPDAFAAAAHQQAACFTIDAIWDGGPFGGTITGRDRIFDFFCRSPWRFTVHTYTNPVLHIDGERADGVWQLWQIGVREPDGATLLVTGRTCETYSYTADGWLVSTMSFEQLHALTLSSEEDALRCLIPLGETA